MYFDSVLWRGAISSRWGSEAGEALKGQPNRGRSVNELLAAQRILNKRSPCLVKHSQSNLVAVPLALRRVLHYPWFLQGGGRRRHFEIKR